MRIKVSLVICILAATLSAAPKTPEGKFFGKFEGKLLASTSRGISIINADGSFEWSHKVGKLHGCEMLKNGNYLVGQTNTEAIAV